MGGGVPSWEQKKGCPVGGSLGSWGSIPTLGEKGSRDFFLRGDRADRRNRGDRGGRQSRASE